MSNRKMQIGVVGLGRAFTLMLPTFVHDSRVKLVGATDPIAAARAQFEKDFGAPGHESIEAEIPGLHDNTPGIAVTRIKGVRLGKFASQRLCQLKKSRHAKAEPRKTGIESRRPGDPACG